MIKTTGAEYKAFYYSNWNLFFSEKECYLYKEKITVDGFDFFGYEKNIKDTSKVVINSGVVLDEDNKEVIGFEKFFRKWKKAQTTTIFTVQIPKNEVDRFTHQVTLCKGKII